VADPIGFVNDALDGAAGLELAFNQSLTGVDGEGVLVADATGRRFDLDPVPVKPLQPGANLHLSLDWGWQSILAEETVAAVEKWKAKSGMALLMNPHTGAILAMVDYNPVDPGRKICKSRLVSDVLEPGSTFKLVTFAGALSDGVVGLHDYFDGGNGQGRFSGRILHDDKRHGIMSTGEVFVVSSNVGTGRVANRLAPGRLEFWARRLGFGQRTGIDLSGESPGQIAQQIHSEFNTATLAIGHGVAITPIQLAAAYATVANGGYLVRPHLVTATESPDGAVDWIETKGERVLRPEVAQLIKGLMARVVSEGTAKVIWDPQFPIAGKTGTAEKPDPRTGGYDKSKYMASFVGFYPANRPRILGLVILDEPQPIHYGGYTAAPVLLNTIRRGTGSDPRSLAFEEETEFRLIETVQTGEEDWARQLALAVAPIVSVAEARAEHADGVSDAVASGSEAQLGRTAWASLQESSGGFTPQSGDSWPDLHGLNLRDAIAALRAMDVRWEIAGSGLVVDQFPPPDSAMGESQICRLTLQ
jgi:cell division protein FtsI (penicillin-binding protein 3)